MVRRRSRTPLVLVTIIAAAIGAYLLVEGDPVSVAPPGTPPGAPDVAPLTGLPVKEGADLDHPAVAIKISNVRQAHPHAGVDRADIVFAEPIGVSYTRLAAVFHSDLPGKVGPVRSVRPMDAPLLGPMSPVFGHTMGAPWVLTYVEGAADLDSLGTLRVRGSGAYTRDGGRPQPDHVFAHPRELLRLSDFTDPPEPYFTYAPNGEPASAEKSAKSGKTAEVPYGPGYRVTWKYDKKKGRYLRREPWGAHVTTDGKRIGATNVLVLEVASEKMKIGTGGGAPVPVLQLIDRSGTFTALSGGKSVTGTWSKGGVDEPFQLRTDDNEDLLLTPGNTWVELPAPSSGIQVR